MMGLKLKITVDQDAGFCFGVTRAISKAEELLAAGHQLYCLGQIVHNHAEVERLEKLGMQSFSHENIDSIKNKTVLIRSHGEPPETYQILQKNGNQIVEATCPIVAKLQEKVERSDSEGSFVMIFGKAEHPEVVGLTGRISGNYIVVKDLADVDYLSLPKSLTLYSQTTMDLDSLNQLRSKLEEEGIEVDFRDTVCRKVSNKKKHLESFAIENDVIIMVAGERSSNGKVLYEICKSKNSRSYKISQVDQVSPEWFKANDRVGITGATSTPTWQIQDVLEAVSKL